VPAPPSNGRAIAHCGRLPSLCARDLPRCLSPAGVPPASQKLMSKAWKAFLKDDVQLSSLAELKDGAVVQLMGSADGLVKPVAQTVRMLPRLGRSTWA
jgi:hypothetical protein